MNKFEKAFIECVQASEYPGPVALNRRMGRGNHIRHLNGRETYERRRLMFEFGVPMKRGNYSTKKGEIPNDDLFSMSWIEGESRRLKSGWRRSELSV